MGAETFCEITKFYYTILSHHIATTIKHPPLTPAVYPQGIELLATVEYLRLTPAVYPPSATRSRAAFFFFKVLGSPMGTEGSK